MKHRLGHKHETPSVSASVRVLTLLLSCYAAATLVLSTMASFSGRTDSPWPSNMLRAFTWQDAALILCLSALFFAVLSVISQRLAMRQHEDVRAPMPPFLDYLRSHLPLFIALILGILVCWIAVWLAFWPGTSMNDQLAVIGGPVETGNNHPLLYNLTLSWFVQNLGIGFLNDGSMGFACYILMQMALDAAAVSLCCIWLLRCGAPRWSALAVAAYFALVPLMQNYAMSSLKDTPFGYVMLLWLPFLYEISVSRRQSIPCWTPKRLVLFAVLFCLTALVRNNGLYISLALAVVLFFCTARGARQRMAFAVAALIALGISYAPNLYLRSQGVTQLFRETVGVPIQQMAAVLCEHGDELDDAELDFLDHLMPIERLRQRYAPMTVDSIKYDGSNFDSWYLQTHRRDFVQLYVKLGLRYPDTYLRALLSQSYGYWSWFTWDSYQSVLFGISDNIQSDTDLAAMDKFGLHNHSLYPEPVGTALRTAHISSATFLPAGACFLIILVATWIRCVRTRSLVPLLPAAPCIFLWGTLLIAAPVALAFRYAFPFVTCLPFLVALAFVTNFPPERTSERA